jgi:predicted RNase H-like HicB family nuclease
MRAMEYTVIVEHGLGNLSAYVPDLPGCVATGGSEAEVLENIRDAVRFHIEGMRAAGYPVPAPTSTAARIAV